MNTVSKATNTMQNLMLVILMSMALLGVQLAQGSALHDHTQHNVECALCHFQLSDDSEISHNVAVEAPPATLSGLPHQVHLPPTRVIHPYQSRAPPSLP